MKTINPEEIKLQLNNCYDKYDPNWPVTIGSDSTMKGFKYHIEHTAGVKLDFGLYPNKFGKMGYKINSIEIVDEPTFLLWMLRWS